MLLFHKRRGRIRKKVHNDQIILSIYLLLVLLPVCHSESCCEPVVVVLLVFNKTANKLKPVGYGPRVLFVCASDTPGFFLLSWLVCLHLLGTSIGWNPFLEQSQQKAPVVKCSEGAELAFLFGSESISLFAWRLCCCCDPAPAEIALSLFTFLWMMGQTIMNRASFVLKQVINNHLHQRAGGMNLSVWNYCNLTHHGLMK